MRRGLKYSLTLFSLSFALIAHAERQTLETSDQVSKEEMEEFNQMMVEQAFLERMFLKDPGIIVTPYYDEFGRWGVKVVSDNSKPYYVDPYYDDPMTTNRHSDEPNTSTNWRMMTW